MTLPLVLASSSPFRRSVLSKLQLPFTHRSPDVDETIKHGENARDLVIRLAATKAQAARIPNQHELIIGSDQVATLDDTILGKPLTHQNAVKQLQACSGRQVVFHTGLSLLNTQSGQQHTIADPFIVKFRPLDKDAIERYLLAEQPYQCAGSFKSEGLGITLFERLEGDDPNTLIGLPLIRLVELLAREGIALP